VLLVRVIALGHLTISPFLMPERGDMHFYDEWAQRILHGQLTDHLAFYGLPLYAYLLAVIYKLVGYGPFLPGLIQAALDAGTAVILYKIGIRIFSQPVLVPNTTDNDKPEIFRSQGELVGAIAALGWAFFAPAQAYAVILMPTVWSVFAFWLLVWLVVRTNYAPSQFACLAYGLLIGFAAMGIATILFLVPLLLAALFLKPAASTNTRPFLSRLTATLLVFCGIGIGTSPCWVHNYLLAHDPVLLSAHSGVNFWIGNNPTATGYPRFPPGLHAGQEAMLADSIKAAEKAAGQRLKRSQVSAFWSAKAKGYIHRHFSSWLSLLAKKLNNFWNAFQYDDLSMISALSEHRVIWPMLRFGLVAALAIPGLLLAVRQFPLSRWIAAAIALHMTSLLSVFVTERYRLAAVPGLLLFAAFGIVYFWQAFTSLNYWRVSAYVLLLLVATWFVSIPERNPSLWALDSYNSGWQALESNNFTLAEKKLNLAYAYVPENAETNFALGNLRLGQGDKIAAKSYYLATLRLDSSHEGAYNNLGILALQEKRWEVAAVFFSKALEQDAGNAKSYYLLAEAHFNSGDLPHARNEAAQALKLNPNQSDFRDLLERIERTKQTREDFPGN
jgi:tetratricopeptide (TPR) repeat protein